MNNKTLNIVGIALTVVGGIASIASGIVTGMKTENIIGEKVAEEVAKQLNNNN